MADDMLPKNIESPRPLHTLQTDSAEIIEKQHLTQVQIMAQQEKARIEKEEAIEAEKLKKAMVVPDNVVEENPIPKMSHMIRNFGIAAVCLGIIFASGYGIFNLAKQRGEEPPVEIVETPEKNTILTYEVAKIINFSPEEMNREGVAAKLLSEARAEENKNTFYDTNISLKTILSTLSPSIPSEYLRSITGKDFFGGTTEGNFFVISVDSYEQAYAGQLQWEQTMKDDLFPIFGITPPTILVRFEDRIVANRDVRVALDAKGNTLFLYGFYRNKTVIFSRTDTLYTTVYEMLLRQNI